ncbi:hypothetical protein V8C40DRAFT_93072 [Trichoderma camerunense]
MDFSFFILILFFFLFERTSFSLRFAIVDLYSFLYPPFFIFTEACIKVAPHIYLLLAKRYLALGKG